MMINLFVNGCSSTDGLLTYKNNQLMIANIDTARNIEWWIRSRGGCGRKYVENFVSYRSLDNLWVIDERA